MQKRGSCTIKRYLISCKELGQKQKRLKEMLVKIKLPSDVTQELQTKRGDKSMAAYIVSILRTQTTSNNEVKHDNSINKDSKRFD